MRIISLMHVPFEDAANLGVWAAERGHTVDPVHLYAGQQPPAVEDVEAVFVMGGPMNIYEEAEHPWLKKEKEFLKKCVERDKILVGVCLGGQLLADVLGGKVTQNPHKEIGWYEVISTADAQDTFLSTVLSKQFWAFHWHGDTFAIPPGAVHLAQSQACRNQAFLYGRHTLGLQFHLEYTTESIASMLDCCSDELSESRYIQTVSEIQKGMRHLHQAKAMLWKILDSICKKA